MRSRESVHGFRPGRLIAGLCALAVAALYAGDVGGEWTVPWFTALPLTAAGLALAGVGGSVHYAVRRRRARSRASSDQ
ncbi:hypothetical protein [Streptomyces sp. NPDC090029]|uniref:hypothetical protein n=1 Tax=Streptomyces sp. NPDC090029 TaxID=3365924 RepID=UPI0037F4EFBC